MRHQYRSIIVMKELSDVSAELVSKAGEYFEVDKLLGCGGQAVVCSARCKATGERVALKFPKRGISLDREIGMLKKIHRLGDVNIASYKDVIKTPSGTAIVIEVVDGLELFDDIMRVYHSDVKTKYSADSVRTTIGDIARTLSDIHSLGIVHRDIKPENVLVYIDGDGRRRTKLIDFGMACEEDDLVAFNEEGTVAYKAPEVLAKENPASKASDVWALGIILYIMMCGSQPFSKANHHPDLPSDIISCRYHFRHKWWEHVEDTPVGVIDLIKKMLHRDPAERITVAGILVHPFITNRQETVPFESKYFNRLRSVGFARYGASLWAVVYVARWLRRTRALLKARKSESDAFVGATSAAASSSSDDDSSLRRSKRCRMK